MGNKNVGWPWGTQVGSANYVEYLTTKYNRSLVLTYNFAWAGATTDNHIDNSPFGSIDFREQVQTQFLPNFGKDQIFRSWKADNSLFIIFFGINDIAMFKNKPNASDYVLPVLRSYENATEVLYDAGARNFLFIDVPAIDRSPSSDIQQVTAQQTATCVQAFNTALQQYTKTFIKRHSDAAVFLLEAYVLTTKVLDNPRNYRITAAIRNTTDFCVAYEQ